MKWFVFYSNPDNGVFGDRSVHPTQAAAEEFINKNAHPGAKFTVIKGWEMQLRPVTTVTEYTLTDLQ